MSVQTKTATDGFKQKEKNLFQQMLVRFANKSFLTFYSPTTITSNSSNQSEMLNRSLRSTPITQVIDWMKIYERYIETLAMIALNLNA